MHVDLLGLVTEQINLLFAVVQCMIKYIDVSVIIDILDIIC